MSASAAALATDPEVLVAPRGRPADAAHRLRAAEWSVLDVPLATARDLVERYHYARGGANTGVYLHGLVRRDDPSAVRGVAWWMPPTKLAAMTVHEDWRRVLSLTRLVCDPEVPANGASFLMARSIRLIRNDERFVAGVTYADTAVGHTGAIYRATNWSYVGVTKPETRWIDPETGRQVARKATRSRTVSEMLELGYERSRSQGKHKFTISFERGTP